MDLDFDIQFPFLETFSKNLKIFLDKTTPLGYPIVVERVSKKECSICQPYSDS